MARHDQAARRRGAAAGGGMGAERRRRRSTCAAAAASSRSASRCRATRCSTSRASRGIVDYAPEELVVTLRAGTPMREVEALLAPAQPDAGLRAARSRPAARPRSGAGHAGRRRDGQPRRPAPHLGRRGARPSAGLQRRQRPRRGLQVGRQGDEERHRLRPLQASGRLVGHARRARRGLGEGAARARPDAHAAAARPRRRARP